jgi:hypothetical protein
MIGKIVFLGVMLVFLGLIKVIILKEMKRYK